jgi:hypothetical protein
MVVLLGSNARFLMITVTVGPDGTWVVTWGVCVTFVWPVGSDTQPPIKIPKNNTMNRITYPFMKSKKRVLLIILSL